MDALALNGTYNPNSIKTKADAMKYAFDLTTEKDFSTGATKIDVEKAMGVYTCFTSNIELPDYQSPTVDGLVEKFNALMTAISDMMSKTKTDE